MSIEIITRNECTRDNTHLTIPTDAFTTPQVLRAELEVYAEQDGSSLSARRNKKVPKHRLYPMRLWTVLMVDHNEAGL